MRLTHLLILMLVALQPAALARAVPVASSEQGHGQGCCAGVCHCPPACEACDSDRDSSPQPQPIAPAPEQTRITSLFAPDPTPIFTLPLPTTSAAPAQADNRTPTSLRVGQRLSLLCLWLT